jgi:hypothetical protein
MKATSLIYWAGLALTLVFAPPASVAKIRHRVGFVE